MHCTGGIIIILSNCRQLAPTGRQAGRQKTNKLKQNSMTRCQRQSREQIEQWMDVHRMSQKLILREREREKERERVLDVRAYTEDSLSRPGQGPQRSSHTGTSAAATGSALTEEGNQLLLCWHQQPVHSQLTVCWRSVHRPPNITWL